MINKKLIHFRELSTFNDNLSQIPDSSVVFIKDASKVYNYNTMFDFVHWGVLESPFVKSSEAVCGDIAVTNGTSIYIVPPPKLSEINTNNYTPIGVVVVPGTHDVYGDGSCSIISLKMMDYENPTEGSFNLKTMSWGANKDISGILNATKVVVYSGTTLSSANFGYLSKSGVWAGGDYNQIPDPYNSDGSRNPDYYNKTVTAYNSCSDFKGASNTNAIITTRGTKDYSSWLPSASTVADYTAGSVCNMYYTPGTKQGDWYLPAMGELGYMMAKWNDLWNSFSLIRETWGEVALNLESYLCLWSSTENAAKNARYLHTDNGAGYSDKTTLYHVMAFCKVKNG